MAKRIKRKEGGRREGKRRKRKGKKNPTGMSKKENFFY